MTYGQDSNWNLKMVVSTHHDVPCATIVQWRLFFLPFPFILKTDKSGPETCFRIFYLFFPQRNVIWFPQRNSPFLIIQEFHPVKRSQQIWYRKTMLNLCLTTHNQYDTAEADLWDREQVPDVPATVDIQDWREGFKLPMSADQTTSRKKPGTP